LEFDGFTSSQATYGVANSHANWDKEAAADAREYLKTEAFSASGMIQQLEFDGFTASQAQYGAKAVGL
jgi:Host cell surface-exposed lipoprotein